jgi:hypothetical protein
VPPSHHRPGGGTCRAQVVDVGRHRVVQEAGLSTRVHRGVPLHENSPSKRLGSACLEGEVSEVIGGEPKMLLRWVWPQHADDGLVRETPDESFPPRSPPSGRWGEVVGRRCARRRTLPARCRRSRGSQSARWPQGSTGPCGRPSDPLVKFVETHDVPQPSAPTVGDLYRLTVNLY